MVGVAPLGWDAGLAAFVAGAVSFFSPCVAPLVPGYMSYLAAQVTPLPPGAGGPEVTPLPPGAGGPEDGHRAAPRSAGRPERRPTGLHDAATRGGQSVGDQKEALLVAANAGGAVGVVAAPHGLATSEMRQGERDAAVRHVVSRGVVRVCLLFVAGFSVAFVALGLVAASFGVLLAAYRLVLETVAGIAMLVMGAFLLELLPRGWLLALAREWRLPWSARALGGLAPFGLGVVFAAGWTPCIGPVLAAILLYAGASASIGQGVTLLSLYALGFALPFIAVGLGWSAGLGAVGWLRRHGPIVTKVSGVALILVGLVYLTGQVSQFSIWAQQLAGIRLG